MSASRRAWFFEQARSLGRYRAFLGGLTVYSGSTGAAQLIMMVYAILPARVLGPSEFGVFAGAYAVAGLSAFLISWGMDVWLLRSAAENFQPAQAAGAVLRTKMALGLAWGAALVLIAPLARPELFTPLLMLVCVVDVWCDGAFNTMVSGLNVMGRMGVLSRLVLASRSARLASAVVVIAAGWASPLAFAAARMLFNLASLLLAALALRPRLSGGEPAAGAALIRRALPFGLSELLSMIYVQADVTMLALLAGKTATGIYSPASGLVTALFVIPSTIYLGAVPALSRLKEQNPAEFRRVMKPALAGFAALGLALTAVIVLAGPLAIRWVLGGAYQSTAILVAMMSPILLLKSIEFGLAGILVAANWQRQRLKPQLAAAAVNVALNLWAIPRFEGYGAAVVYSISEVILAAGYALLVMKWRRGSAREAGE